MTFRIMPRKRVKKSRGKRRGRVTDKPFMEFVRGLGCILRGKHVCVGPVQFHHIRETGSPKNDRRGVGLCVAGHLHEGSMFSIHRLGKPKFQEHWHVDLEAEMARNTALYQGKKESEAA